MKPIPTFAAFAIAATLAACVPQARPVPQAPVRPAPPPAATPPPAPVGTAWLDQPASRGNWYYRNDGAQTLALFGTEQTQAEFFLRCDRAARKITLAYAGEADEPIAMRIRTETQDRLLTARTVGSALPYLEASVPAGDRLLDAMALSKGRFAVDIAGQTALYLPAWAEVTRVIEDCR